MTYLLQTYLPTGVLVCLSWISFLVPPDNIPGRMALLVTLTLMVINIFLRVSAEIPTAKVTALSAWILISLFMVRRGTIS